MTVANNFGKARVPLVVGVLASCGIALGGCMSSPTYGTGKPAGEQFIEDVTGILSLAPKDRPKIDYKPRPELVTPETTAVLPPPQDSVTTASNGVWPESPEERLARIRAEATENQTNPLYRPSVQTDIAAVSVDRNFDPERDASQTPRNPQAQREAFKKALAERQGSNTQRKYLSEPPLTYRVPADTAPVDDIGEDEWKKERDAKRQARANSTKKRSWWPW